MQYWVDDSFSWKMIIRTFELTDYYLIPFLNERNRFSHKGDYGHGFLIAGSLGKGGAAILSSAGANAILVWVY
jgi:NAD(P)H-hydrate epimerase